MFANSWLFCVVNIQQPFNFLLYKKRDFVVAALASWLLLALFLTVRTVSV